MGWEDKNDMSCQTNHGQRVMSSKKIFTRVHLSEFIFDGL